MPSRPQICFDRKTDPAAVLDVLAQGLLSEAGPANLISLYSWLPLSHLEHYGFRIRQLEGNVVLDLTHGPEKLMKQFHSERRRHIRFAIRQGLEVSQACVPTDLAECYQLYCQWRQTPRKKIEDEQVPFSTFEQAWSLTENRRAFLVRLNGKVIAADVVRFCSGGLLEAAGNFSADEFLRLRPNDLVIWRIIEWACKEGFTRLSLGGAHLFLRHFGGALVPIYRHRLDRTWLRRYNMREAIVDFGRKVWHKAPLKGPSVSC
jgi:lipid II:glycine glycyltransferase (peptidoglycan interpeptide bridge formation enzyme)